MAPVRRPRRGRGVIGHALGGRASRACPGAWPTSHQRRSLSSAPSCCARTRHASRRASAARGRCGESPRGVAALHAQGSPPAAGPGPWRVGWSGPGRAAGVACRRRAGRGRRPDRAGPGGVEGAAVGGRGAGGLGSGTVAHLRRGVGGRGGAWHGAPAPWARVSVRGIPPGTFAASGGALPTGASGAFGGSGVEVSRRRRRVRRGECRSRSRPPCTTPAPPGARAVRAARPRTGRSVPPGCRVDPDSKR